MPNGRQKVLLCVLKETITSYHIISQHIIYLSENLGTGKSDGENGKKKKKTYPDAERAAKGTSLCSERDDHNTKC